MQPPDTVVSRLAQAIRHLDNVWGGLGSRPGRIIYSCVLVGLNVPSNSH